MNRHRLRSGLVPGRIEPSRGRELLVFALPVVVLAVSMLPAVLAESRQYTWSLAIFALPVALLLAWLWRSPGPRQSVDRRAILGSLAILLPLGLVLDFFFADELFHFQNREAVVGIYLPALDLAGIGEVQAFPIEELAFYVSGFLFLLLAYSWSGQRLAARGESRPPVCRRSPAWSLLPAVLPLGGLVLWSATSSEVIPRAPTYLIFILVVPSGLAAVLLPGVAHRIDWHALAFTTAFFVWMAFLWEAVLAVPNGWWGYRPEAMVGLFVAPQLPIEAVAVWVLAPPTSTVVLETVRKWCGS